MDPMSDNLSFTDNIFSVVHLGYHPSYDPAGLSAWGVPLIYSLPQVDVKVLELIIATDIEAVTSSQLSLCLGQHFFEPWTDSV